MYMCTCICIYVVVDNVSNTHKQPDYNVVYIKGLLDVDRSQGRAGAGRHGGPGGRHGGLAGSAGGPQLSLGCPSSYGAP